MINNILLKKIIEFISTGFFTGYSPIIPGTVGTLIGVVIYIFFSKYNIYYYIFLSIFTISAIFIADYSERFILEVKDSKHIVIDEIVGFLITMISFNFHFNIESIKNLIIGFILFRFIDICKPYPIKNLQKIKGGLGIVIDDIIAGIISNMFLQFLRIYQNFIKL